MVVNLINQFKRVRICIWIRNIVYREVFQSYCYDQQISPVEDIDDLSLLNETFPSSVNRIHSSIM